MKAWRASLADPPPTGRTVRPEGGGNVSRRAGVWQRPPESERDDPVPIRDRSGDPDVRTAKRDHIVPRRPGVTTTPMPDDSFWTSHHFWKGIVVGAVVVILIKTVLAVRAPFGVDWYGF